MNEPKPKRIYTQEQLDKLAIARAKANEVRSKRAMVKKAEKKEKNEQLEAKFNSLVASKKEDTKKDTKEDTVEQPKNDTGNVEQQEVKNEKVKKPKVKKVVEIDSEDGTSESSSDEEYDFSAVKNKYKEKYKHKYGAKYNMMKQNPYFTTPYQDAFTLAKHNLQSKINNEMKKVAFSSLFGS